MHDECHWSLGVIDFVKERIQFLDSQFDDDRYCMFKRVRSADNAVSLHLLNLSRN